MRLLKLPVSLALLLLLASCGGASTTNKTGAPVTGKTSTPQSTSVPPQTATPTPQPTPTPRPASTPTSSVYSHIFVIVEENHEYGSIIGNVAAPNINRLASSYGLATNYYGVSHPSEPNYVAMLGGSFYSIYDDNPYYVHMISNASLVDQLEGRGLTWKGYFQSLPYAGYTGVCYPGNCLYGSKHDAFLNFAHVRNSSAGLQKLAQIAQLTLDLQSGHVPNFGLIAPDQCHDMHGASPCLYGDSYLVGAADAYLATLVSQITNSSFWLIGNNAIIITWDEGSSGAGCCDAYPGGGHVATIVITSHGPRGRTDGAYYNHYSLLRSIEQVFGLGCIQFTCDAKAIAPMTSLFAIPT